MTVQLKYLPDHKNLTFNDFLLISLLYLMSLNRKNIWTHTFPCCFLYVFLSEFLFFRYKILNSKKPNLLLLVFHKIHLFKKNIFALCNGVVPFILPTNGDTIN